jgi:hypothetical protein
MAGGWCDIEGQRGTYGWRGGAAPTTSERCSTDGRRGGSPPTRRWRRDRRTPTTGDLKLQPQDLHHAYEGWTKEANSTTSDNKFVLLPPYSIDVDPNLLCTFACQSMWLGVRTLLDFQHSICLCYTTMRIASCLFVEFMFSWLNSLSIQNISDCPSIWLSYTNWITRSGWCGERTSTRRWQRGRRTPTTNDLKLLPQDPDPKISSANQKTSSANPKTSTMPAKGGAQKKPQAPRQITSLCSFHLPAPSIPTLLCMVLSPTSVMGWVLRVHMLWMTCHCILA